MLPVPADVTDRDGMLAAAARVREEFGPIDVAVLNAAHWGQMSVAAWDSELSAGTWTPTCMGMVHGIEAVLPGHAQAPVGHDRRAGFGWPGTAGCLDPRPTALPRRPRSTCWSRSGSTWRPPGSGVVTVCPGFVRTDLTAANTFPMPFMMEPDEAARRICDGIDRGKAEIVFPLPMMLAMKAARLVPVRLWAWGFAKVPQRSAATGADSATPSAEGP